MRRVTVSVAAVVAVVIGMVGAVAAGLAQDPPLVPHQRLVAGSGGSLLAVSTDGTSIRTAILQVDRRAAPAPSSEVVVSTGDELVANPVAAWNPTAQRYLLMWQRLDASKALLAIAYTWIDAAGMAVGSPGVVAAIEPDEYGRRPPVYDPHSEPLTAACSRAADTCLVTWNDPRLQRAARFLHAGEKPASSVVAVGAEIFGGASGAPLTSSACAPDGGSCMFVSSTLRLRAYVVIPGSASAATVAALDLGPGGTASPVAIAEAGAYTIAWWQSSPLQPRRSGIWAARIDDGSGVLVAPHIISRHDVSNAALGLTAPPALKPFVLFAEDERIIAVRTDRELNDARSQAVVDSSGADPLGSTAAARGTPQGDVLTSYASVVADPTVAFRGIRNALAKFARLPDRLAPWLEVQIKTSASRSILEQTLYCDERCTVRGRVELSGPGKFSIPFRTTIASAAKGRRVRVRVRPRDRTRLVKWLYSGARVEQTVTAAVSDAAGNRRRATANAAYEGPVSVDRPLAPRCEKAPGKTILMRGSMRLYTTSSSELMFWWVCQTGETRRILIAGGYAGTYVRSTLLRRDRLLLVDVGYESTDGTESAIVLYDMRSADRRYRVDFKGAEVESLELATNGAAAATVRDGPWVGVWGISPTGRAARLALSGPDDDPPKRIGSLRLENETVFWTENGVEHSAPVPG